MSALTVTTIQTDIVWEDKEANLRMLEEKILALSGPLELVVLPELFSTGFAMEPERFAETMDGPTLSWMKAIAARKRIILTGSIIIREGEAYFNRLIWMQPDGVAGYYDKRHRFAFAGEDRGYTAGRKRLIASVKGWKVLPLVCYDLRFPVWSRQTATAWTGPAGDQPDPEYDLLLYVANWPQRRSHAWKTLLQARAIENQCFVVGVNRTGNDGSAIFHSGDTMIVDPLGEVLHHASEKEEVFTLTLQREALEEVRRRYPFWRDADRFSIET